MPGISRADTQRYSASGEATEQGTVPRRFQSAPVASSPLSGHLAAPVDHTSFSPGQPNAVVLRAPRMIGMRYLYAAGHVKMPIQRLGADGTPLPWDSSYQPDMHGPIHDAGFNDALYQAGYPGFNLGLSFKVQTLPENVNGPGMNMRMHGPLATQPASRAVNRLRRSSGKPRTR